MTTEAAIFQSLGLPLNTSVIRYPNTIAAPMPPAAPVRPPVSAPIIQLLSTAVFTPSAREYPNPRSGVVAPHPAKSTIGL